MYDLKFIIDDDVNELEILRIRNREAVRNQSYQLIINPTLECNFRCWYCYENHKKGHMNETTVENIKKLADEKPAVEFDKTKKNIVTVCRIDRMLRKYLKERKTI